MRRHIAAPLFAEIRNYVLRRIGSGIHPPVNMPLCNEIRRFKRNTAVITAVYNYQFDFHLFGYNRLDIHAGAISYLYSAFKLRQPCEIRCKLYKNPVVLYRPYNAGNGFTYRKTFCVLLPRSEQFLVRKCWRSEDVPDPDLSPPQKYHRLPKICLQDELFLIPR